jgi:hypothetical protein
MAKSGLGGRFLFCATQNGVICRNVTLKQSIGTTPFEKMYGMKKDVSKFRLFGCSAYMHLNKDRREKGRHAPKAVEAMSLGFANDCNTSGYKLYIEGTGKVLISNQVKFNENLYPYQNSEMVSQHLNDITVVDVMSLQEIMTGSSSRQRQRLISGDLKRYTLVDRVILTSCARHRTQGFIWELRRRGVKKEEFFKSLLNKRAE